MLQFFHSNSVMCRTSSIALFLSVDSNHEYMILFVNFFLFPHRELMITSHQNRIEQLRESFKQKLLEAENWPHKVSKRNMDPILSEKLEI